MPASRYVYDADEVQYETRRQAWQVAYAMTGTAVLTVGITVLAAHGVAPLAVAGLGLPCLWTATACWTARITRRLRHTVWCLALSAGQVEGYDYTRQRITLPWSSVARVELDDDALRIVRSRHCYLYVDACFPCYTDLGHRVVARAEQHGVPVCIGGVPYQEVDLHSELAGVGVDRPTDTPGACPDSAHA